MKKHISYPKIAQFRNVVSNINREITFTGLDEDGNAIYDPSIKKPTLTFKGTVKLHGTNASVCFNSENGFWIQSRQDIITPEKDNAGFAFFAESRKSEFLTLLEILADEDDNIDSECTISIYGEWAGKGIQKGVGISQLEKAFYVFGVKVSKPQNEEFNSYWIDSSNVRNTECRIFNVEDYETYSIDVDFNMPQLAQNKFGEITEKVENECPISKAFGIDNGLGEGVVWSVNYKDSVHRFKVKGEKHSVSKVRTLAHVDVEKLENVKEFVEYSVTENRFNQAIENVFGKEDLDVKKMGDFIRWFIKDITSEEMDTMLKNGLEPRDVNRHISAKVREMFFKAQSEY
jgi:hypothetical protein|tara:strand:- start:2273 stop:3307 length:1035 start_codon:yes stop_codon:yes gene_type:complete